MGGKKDLSKTKRLPIAFPIDLKLFAEANAPKEIHVLPTGKWNHPAYGPIVITAKDITQFKANFDAGIRKAIPITEGHEFCDEKPAIGWFKELIDKGEAGLFAVVEWTKQGKTLLKDRAYKFFSPEFYSVYDDPESREITENVLVGGALTNKPYFKELKAVVMSEHLLNQFNFNDMDLKDILQKAVADLNDEERAFVKEHKEDLTEEQLTSFGSVFEAEPTDPPKDPVDPPADPPKDPVDPPKDPVDPPKDPVDPPAEPARATEPKKGKMIQVEAAEFANLTSMANRGALAFEENRQIKIKSQADALIFSEQNSQGRVLPKHEAKVFNFMLSLSAAQRTSFAEIVKSIPASNLFNEIGSGDNTEGTAVKELQTKIDTLRKEDKALTYADGLRKVLSENPGLAKRYEDEQK